MKIALYRFLTGRCQAQRRRPASRCSSSPAEATPHWPGSGTGSAAGRSSAVEAAAGDTSSFYTVLLHCCNLGSRIQVMITCDNKHLYELHCSQHLQVALTTFIRIVRSCFFVFYCIWRNWEMNYGLRSLSCFHSWPYKFLSQENMQTQIRLCAILWERWSQVKWELELRVENEQKRLNLHGVSCRNCRI